MDYKEKYLKYKKKYIELKKMSGGTRAFTKINKEYYVLEGLQRNILKSPPAANTANIENIPLNVYFANNYSVIFGNSINVEAYLYPFNHPLNNPEPTKLNLSLPPVTLNRITISNYGIDNIKNLFKFIPRSIPRDTFLLCVAYTHNGMVPGQQNENFLDVQLCITGGSKDIDRNDVIQTAQREIKEECGLNVLGGLDYIAQISQNGRQHSYLLNAKDTTLTTNTVYVAPTGTDNKKYKTAVMIYGTLPYLQSLLTAQLTRTDVNDVQGLVLVRLT